MIYNVAIVRQDELWEIQLILDGVINQKVVLSDIDVDLIRMINELLEHPDASVLYVI